MLRTFDTTDHLQPRLEEIEQQVTDAYRDGTVRSEDRISGYLSGLLATKLDDRFTSGSDTVRINVDAFESSDEPESGVDIGMRYQLATDRFNLSTGILIQSKRFGETDVHLRSQCYKMLTRTQEAYLFTYASDEIGVVPALPVYCDGGTGGKFTKYYRIGFVPFLSRFLEGYHGDLSIAEAIDQPAEAFPVPERVRYLVDIRARINRDEVEFAPVDAQHYTRIRPDELD